MLWTDAYKKMSDIYIKEFENRESEGVSIAESIHDLVISNFPAVERILDIPCGIGRIAIPLARHGYKVIGIDFSEPFITHAKKRSDSLNLENVDFCAGNIFDSEDRIRDFNPQLIINWWTSIGYYGKKNDVKFFKHLRTITEPGTLFILETWHRENIISFPVKRFWSDLGEFLVLVKQNVDPFSKYVNAEHTYYNKKGNILELSGKFKSRIMLYDVAELKKMLTSCGWIVKEVFNSFLNKGAFNPLIDRVVFICYSS